MRARKTVAPLIVFAGLAAASSAFADARSSILGEWARGDGVAKVRIAPCGGDLCAINTWIKPGVQDEKAGDKLVMNVQPSGASQLTGTAFDPQRDRSYKISVDVGGSSMTTRGCILGVLCKSVGWTRIGK